jgi:hypothetical protein
MKSQVNSMPANTDMNAPLPYPISDLVFTGELGGHHVSFNGTIQVHNLYFTFRNRTTQLSNIWNRKFMLKLLLDFLISMLTLNLPQTMPPPQLMVVPPVCPRETR